MKKLSIMGAVLAVWFLVGGVVYAEEVVGPLSQTASTTEPIVTEIASSTEPIVPTIPPVHISLTIESQSSTLFSGTLDVTACPETQGSATTTVNAFCALEQSGVPVTWSWWGEDAFLDTISGVGNDYGAGLYWLWFTDLEPGATSFNKHTLRDGESLLVTIGRMPMKLSVASTTPMVGATTTVTVSEFGFDSSWNSVWLPSASSTVNWGGEMYTTDANGVAYVTATSVDALDVYATKTGFLDTAHMSVSPVPAPLPSTAIMLDVESSTATLFSGPLNVTACPETQGSATTTINAFCALDQSGLSVAWSWWGEDAFLDSISGVTNDYGANQYWSWFTNLEMGATSFNKHILADNESLLVTIGRMPMKIVPATTTPVVGVETTATIYEFGFDSSWNAVWLPAASSTVTVGADAFITDISGVVAFTPFDTNQITVTASKDGFLTPTSVIVTPVVVATTTPPVTSGGGGGGGGSTPSAPTFNTALAYAYLASVQDSDGSFGSDMVTDWVALALAGSGAPSDTRAKLRAYLETNSASLSSATDYERHAMALMALGLNPQNYGGNIIQKIVSFFDGNQVGDTGLVNDDIFALFPLAHTGYGANDEIIKKTIQFIVAKQAADGHWDSIDVTAAGIQALSLFPGEPGVSSAVSKAKDYLKAHQSTDGGWWNTFSTSWVLQGVAALGETPSQWSIGSNSPLATLASAQLSDGSVGAATDSVMMRTWGTAYAIPGVLGTPWHTLMSSFPRTSSVGGGGANGDMTATTTPILIASSTQSTLFELATSTSEIATTTASTTVPTVVATSTSTTTPVVVEPRIIKKAVPTTQPVSVATTTSTQVAKVPENRVSALITQFFAAIGGGISALFGWFVK